MNRFVTTDFAKPAVLLRGPAKLDLAARRSTLGIPRQHLWIARAVGALVCAVLIGVGASVRIPLPWTPVPITLQTLVVFLGAAFLGRHYAVQMVGWYLGLGVCGAPLFAGGASGFGAFVGPTGGYLVGFLAAAGWIGYTQSRVRGFWSHIALFTSASLMIFLIGATWLSFSLHLNLSQSFMAGVLPFLPGDVLKVFVAATLVGGVKKAYFGHIAP